MPPTPGTALGLDQGPEQQSHREAGQVSPAQGHRVGGGGCVSPGEGAVGY